jgi:hypothetical protein
MQRLTNLILGSALLTICALSVACARTGTKGANGVGDADLSADEQNAAQKIAEARCARQTPACGSVLDSEVCVGRKLLPSAVDVDLADCSSAINEQNLHACVVQIRAGKCGSGITNISACAHDNLCPGVAAEEGTS